MIYGLRDDREDERLDRSAAIWDGIQRAKDPRPLTDDELRAWPVRLRKYFLDAYEMTVQPPARRA